MHPLASEPTEVIAKHLEGHGYAYFIDKYLEPLIIEHINFEGSYKDKGVQYHFFKGRNKFWYLPFRTYAFIERKKADVILVAGLIFPLQVIFLRLKVGRKCRIIVQHHGERPFRNFKRVFQRIANSFIDGYLFTSHGNAKEWIEQVIISREKCFEVLEASTFMRRKDKNESRSKLGIGDISMLLWVGRLERNKDPMTVLCGFEQYLKLNGTGVLYMIYQENELLEEVRTLIESSEFLKKAVRLVGKVDHAALDSWFSAADYFVSGSHKEGSGYALIEAMSCGCVPIVTNIPSFKKITGGQGLLFEPGNPESLCKSLMQLERGTINEQSNAIVHYFNNSLSFEKIAGDIFRICKELSGKGD